MRTSVFRETWNDFLRAIQSPEPFNAVEWTLRLLGAAFKDLQRELVVVRPFVPIFGVSLVLFCVLSYVASIRTVIRSRWCNLTESSPFCYEIYCHDGIVLYFAFMITYHYIQACFSSPGVALRKDHGTLESYWSARKAQGGCFMLNAKCHPSVENRRVALFGSLDPKENGDGLPTDVPENKVTYCDKCDIYRPPRCHHCGTCNRCILQFDHHCVWLNQCIGYSNYRHFVLLLLFIMLGCWYGVAVLFYPFYDPLRDQVRKHGWKFLYSRGTGFLDLPYPGELIYMLVTLQGWPSKIVIDIVYPFLLGLGTVMSVFLGTHLKYILTARTTLDSRIVMARRYNAALDGNKNVILTNPFDQGKWRNCKQIFGEGLLSMFLPVSREPAVPFRPKKI